MPSQHLELSRRLFDLFTGSFASGDVETALSEPLLETFFDPGIEWFPVAQSLLATEHYEGYDGVRRFWTEFLSMWDRYAIEPLEIVEVGDQVATVMHMQGTIGDLEVNEIWSSLATFRDGRIVRIEGFTSRDGAFKAASS